MGIKLARGLIFNKVLGVDGFTNIMIEGTDSRQQAVSANGFGSLLSQIGNLQAVLIGSRRMVHQMR